MSNIARKVILDELIENTHPEKVEDVIFWALEEYCKNRKTNGSLIAFSIKERILEAEKGRDDEFLNPETVNSVFP